MSHFISLALTLLCTSLLIDTSTSSFTFYSMHVVRSFPHDDKSFTEGLCLDPRSLTRSINHSTFSTSSAAGINEIDNLIMFESSGVPRKSELRQVDLVTGRVLNRVKLATDFAEGCAVVDDTVYQMTYQEKRIRAFNVSRANTWINESSVIDIKAMPQMMREGWGMASSIDVNPIQLFASDGSSRLFALNTTTLNQIDSVPVHFPRLSLAHQPIELTGLNELEWVEGEIWANIFGRACIARINPSNGFINGLIVKPDTIVNRDHSSVRVMNGIAWLPGSQTLLVTGKLWPAMYQVKVVQANLLDEMTSRLTPKQGFDLLCPTARFTQEDEFFQASLQYT